MKKILFSVILVASAFIAFSQNNIVNTGNMQIHSGANMVFFGNFTNNGTYTQSAGTFTFDGTSAQTLSGSGATTFYNLVINNTSSTGVTFSGGNVNVTNTLTLTDGKVYTDNSNLLILSDNATVSGGSGASYVVGPYQKTGDDAFTFHVGTESYYMPISITAPGNATDAFTAEAKRGDPKTVYGSAKDGALNKVSDKEYWILNRTTGSSNVTVTLGWSSDSSYIGNLSDLRVVQWDGSQWANKGNTSTSGTISSGTITASSASSSFGGFSFGTTTNLNPLPVTLMSFTAVLNNEIVDLNWVTATEINNDYFTVEKTIDGKEFEFVSKVKGAGNSSQKLKYHTIDPTPYKGVSFYRLKQTNFDQSFSYSNLVAVNITDNKSVNIYPNPSVDGKVSLIINNPNDPISNLLITDINGKIVYSEILNSANSSKFTINLENLNKGLYFVKVSNSTGSQTQKLTIQ